MSISERLASGELWNPYDFANPVNDDDLFAGRGAELEDVRYYLRLAAKAPRPINIVLTGPRSAGKTSFLNKIEHEAAERGFIVARIDLNEADASPIALFYKVYDAIITAAMEDGAFAGFGGDVYADYRRVMDGGGAPSEMKTHELLFPAHYALAVAGGRTVSEPILKRDLETIASELNKPCVLLFDECDVLAKSRIELEMMRNVFMNTSGYMLVFAGTPNLFPVMEEVFSPIVRQFKKIPVENFRKFSDTAACIDRPLESIGIKAEEVVDSGYLFYTDVHRLSAGRPYEIQLLCHYMFRRLEEGRARRMAITVDVLDDVLRELETQERDAGRQLISKLHSFRNSDFRTLQAVTAFHGTPSQLHMRAVLFGDESATLEEIEASVQRFREAGLLDEDSEGQITFRGDQFDEVYARYFAAAHDAAFYVGRWDFPEEIKSELEVLLREVPSVKVLELGSGGAEELRKKVDEALTTLVYDTSDQVVKALPDLASDLYGPIVDELATGQLRIAEVKLEVEGTCATAWVVVGDKSEDFLANEALARLSERAEKIGATLLAEVFERSLPSKEFLLERVKALGSPSQLASFSGVHQDLAYEAHRAGDYSLALDEFFTAHSLDPAPSTLMAQAHCALALEEWPVAEEHATQGRQMVFDRLWAGKESSDSLEQYFFACYDLAVSRVLQGGQSGAVLLLEECEMVLEYLEEVDGFLAVVQSLGDGWLVTPRRVESGADVVRKLARDLTNP